MNAVFPPWPYYDQDEMNAVARVLRSGKVNYWTGDEGRSFEREFADYVGCRYGVALANGTVALEAALRALGIGPGDEVVVPARTFIASASCAVMCGAKPVVADVDEGSGNLSVATIDQARTPNTKAVIAVHMGGWPCDMPAIMAYAEAHALKVIEDCAQAHGATVNGKYVGSFGDVAAFSFCQDKIMSTGGEGGVLVTNNKHVWEKTWSLKDHGKDYDLAHEAHSGSAFRWLHQSFGTNWRMTEMQAAIGRIQLKKMPEWLAQRRDNAAALYLGLQDAPGLKIPDMPIGVSPAFYRAYVLIDSATLECGWDRNRIVKELKARGVPCSQGSCCEIYRERAFLQAGLSPLEPLPAARTMGETSMCFPVHPGLSVDHMRTIAETVVGIMTEAAAV